MANSRISTFFHGFSMSLLTLTRPGSVIRSVPISKAPPDIVSSVPIHSWGLSKGCLSLCWWRDFNDVKMDVYHGWWWIWNYCDKTSRQKDVYHDAKNSKTIQWSRHFSWVFPWFSHTKNVTWVFPWVFLPGATRGHQGPHLEVRSTERPEESWRRPWRSVPGPALRWCDDFRICLRKNGLMIG